MPAGPGETATVLSERRGPVGWVTLNRPDALNARNAEMRDGIAQALGRFDADAEVRVIVLTGRGRSFSVGLDLKEAASAGPGDGSGPADVVRLSAVRKPTIAAVGGFVLGGGCELALACDLRIAAAGARFGFPEVRRGLIPGAGGTQRLPRLIGLAAATRLLMLGEAVTADEAQRIGLVDRVVEDAELPAAAQSLAESVAAGAPLAQAAVKRALAASLAGPSEAGLALERRLAVMLRASEDFREGVEAFRQRRPPRWRGQ